jgi:RNA polymerase sigma factor (sigma-70 family)
MIDVNNIYKENRKVIFNLVLKNSGNKSDAADVLQEGVIALWQNSKKENFVLTATVNTYLYSICKNIWLQKLKKRGIYVSLNPNSSSADLSDQSLAVIMEKEKSFNLLEESILMLGNTCQQILKLFYFEKKSMDDVAQIIGLNNAKTAKSKKYKCLQQLKNKMN